MLAGALAGSPWAPLMAIGGQKQILLYNTDTLELAGVIPFVEGSIQSLTFSRTGRLLVAWSGFGFDAFSAIVTKPAIQDAVIVSIQTGLIAAVLATLLGTLAGIAMARHPGKWAFWFIGLLLLVSVTPEIVDAVALLPWLVFLGQDLGIGLFSDGIVRLVVGHSLFAIAVVSYGSTLILSKP